MKLSAALLLLITTPVFAQQQPITPDACLDRLPENVFKRVPVFLDVSGELYSDSALPGIDLFAQSVGFKIREMLGSSDGSALPEADSVVDWKKVWGAVSVTVPRDGPIMWDVPMWSFGADTSTKSSLGIVVRALKAVVDAGEQVAFPDGYKYDRIVFSLSLMHPRVSKDGRIVPLQIRQPLPVFSLKVPWSTSARMDAFPRIDLSEIHGNLSGTSVTLAFAIDKSGKVDQESVQEFTPPRWRIPPGVDSNSYNAYVRALKRDLHTGRFTAAVVGGCTVRTTTLQRFDYGAHPGN